MYHQSSEPPSWTTADEEIRAYAAVSSTCVATRGAIPCVLRQCANNKDDQNKDDYDEDNQNCFKIKKKKVDEGPTAELKCNH